MPSKNAKPPHDWDWEVPAVIAKADIVPTQSLVGKVNAFAMEVAGECRKAGTVLFKGFAGAIDTDGKYHGVYRLAATGLNDGNDTFASLPGFGSVDAPSLEPTVPPVDELDLDGATVAEE